MSHRLLSLPFLRHAAPLLGGALLLATASAAPAAAQPRGDQALPADVPVMAIVKVPKPWYAPRFLVTRKMRDTMPEYAALPGLAYKAYAFAQADGAYGGVYLWKDAASARAWFAPAWFERVQRERGSAADVRFLRVLAAVDTTPGGTPTDPHSASVATLTLNPVASAAAQPPGEATLAADRVVPGLLRRYHVVDDAGHSGMLSLWRDAAAARAVLDGATQAAAEWFDTPILLPSTLAGNQPRLPGL